MLWQSIQEHDNGITNFHFEVAADLLNDEEIRLIRQMRPGLIQLEIGVQSTNTDTIREIRRTMRLEEVREHVARIKEKGNIHQQHAPGPVTAWFSESVKRFVYAGDAAGI